MATDVKRKAYRISEFCEVYGVGRTFVYEEIAKGKLEARKVGRTNIITAEAGDRWLASLPLSRDAA